MRILRVVLGLLVAVAGLLAMVAGAAAALYVGRDDTVDTGPRQLTSKGAAIATNERLLEYHGPTLHVSATPKDPKRQLFLGVARDFDVISYLGGRQHSELTEVKVRPVRLGTQEIAGARTPLTRPAALDWWVLTGSGSLAWPIEDGPYALVIMNADGTPAVDADVTIGLEVDGAFVTCLLVAAAGLILLAAGLLLAFRRRDRPARVLPAALALFVLTGCAALPEKNATDTLTRPAVTEQAAKDLLTRYDKVSNTAGAKQDDRLIATVEAGPQLLDSRAWSRIRRAHKQKYEPYTFVAPRLGLPEFGSYPMSFVVTAELSTDRRVRGLGLFERRSAGDPWRKTYNVWLPTGAAGLDLTGVAQYSTTVEQGLTSRPKNAAVNLVGYLNLGARSPLAKGFRLDANTIAMLRERTQTITRDNQATWSATVRNSFTLTGTAPPVALADGSALVFLTVQEQHRIWCAPGSDLSWTVDSEPGAFDRRMYGSWIGSTTQHQLAMIVPPRRTGGPIQLLGINSQVVGANGF